MASLKRDARIVFDKTQNPEQRDRTVLSSFRMPLFKHQASFSLSWLPSVVALGSDDVLNQVFGHAGVPEYFTPVDHGGLPY